MKFEINSQKAWAEKYEALIENHKETRDCIHPYSFLIMLDDVLLTVNDYSAKDFEKRLTASLRNDLYPFSLFHKKKHLSPVEHVAFLNAFFDRMNKRGRVPSLRLTHRDIETRIVEVERQHEK